MSIKSFDRIVEKPSYIRLANKQQGVDHLQHLKVTVAYSSDL